MQRQAAVRSAGERSRILVLASTSDLAAADCCVDLLATERPATQRVLALSYGRRPTRIADHWETVHGTLPDSMAVICPESRVEGEPQAGVHTTHVPTSDLTGASIALSRYLDRWAETEAPIAVCLDSVSSLLDATARDRVFRFLHTVTSRCLAVDATVHAHLDPDRADDQTVATVATLFDAVVRREADGRTIRE
ncbi:DUF7504 family protein [Halorientalis halophila]|uniref:DUF7504 family protein n=1 Tax=Halorientalis halophila TaxID=3108499 RepID=UPI003008FF1E